METNDDGYLSKRGQQIMEIAYERGRITATELEAELPGSPSNSTVRTQLRILEERGNLTHLQENGRFVYMPARTKPSAARAAMQRFLRTFVDGSLEKALVTLLSAKEAELSAEELERLKRIVDEAAKRGQDK